MAKVSSASKELIEDVERIPTPSSTLTSLLMLLHAFCAMLIVDFAKVAIGKCFVGFRYFDELFVGLFVSRVLIGVILFR